MSRRRVPPPGVVLVDAPRGPDPMGGPPCLAEVRVPVTEMAIFFGGCLVRGEASSSLGSTDEADLGGAWPDVFANVRACCGEAEMVVRGHGVVGETSLLDHTPELLAG